MVKLANLPFDWYPIRYHYTMNMLIANIINCYHAQNTTWGLYQTNKGLISVERCYTHSSHTEWTHCLYSPSLAPTHLAAMLTSRKVFVWSSMYFSIRWLKLFTLKTGHVRTLRIFKYWVEIEHFHHSCFVTAENCNRRSNFSGNNI